MQPMALLSVQQPVAQVIIEFTSSERRGETLTCTEPAVLLFGRDRDCEPRFPRQGHEKVSRHHCLLDINPPSARLRDLGSRNGTFLNGELVGRRPQDSGPGPQHTSRERELRDGDEVRLSKDGQVAFRVHLRPALASAVDINCAWCQREVRAERGADRPGPFICSDCRSNVQATMRDLFRKAQRGSPELRAIRDYVLLEELGHGGMGAVYLARHRRTGEPVAVKLMLPQVAADERAVEMFQREVRNTMCLADRHVVRLLDHGYARGAFFLVLEYCDGGSVEQILGTRGGKLPVDEATEIVLQALDGLEYCHGADIPFVRQKGGGFAPGKGLVHRDLKPDNLFLTGWGSSRIVKIGDYGLAKAFEETGLTDGTRTGALAGTWEFMCRKQVAHYRNAGPEVDVWSLAASFYYLLTGFVPRDFGEQQDPWLVVLESPAVPILQRNSQLPPGLAEVIDHALCEEPDLPFKTAAGFRHALEGSL